MLQLEQVCDLIRTEEAAIWYEFRGHVSSTTDAFIASTGDMLVAAQAYTCSRRERRNPTALKPE